MNLREFLAYCQVTVHASHPSKRLETHIWDWLVLQVGYLLQAALAVAEAAAAPAGYARKQLLHAPAVDDSAPARVLHLLQQRRLQRHAAHLGRSHQLRRLVQPRVEDLVIHTTLRGEARHVFRHLDICRLVFITPQGLLAAVW